MTLFIFEPPGARKHATRLSVLVSMYYINRFWSGMTVVDAHDQLHLLEHTNRGFRGEEVVE
jgi:hypothetical protein